MINEYERKKQKKESRHNDMQSHVSKEAERDFKRKAYYEPDIKDVKEILNIKRKLSYLEENAGRLDEWEKETIRRIAKGVQERQ